ncbi:MAG: hypothetical protein WA946_15590 [Nitrospirota bacterium]
MIKQIIYKTLHLPLLGLLLVVICPALSFADAVTMSIQPNGQGSFVMTGENVIGVQALDIEIDYDSTMLAHPYITVGGGELRQIKDNVPGTLFLSIFRPVADPLLQIFVNFEEAWAENATKGIYHVTASVRSTTAWPSESDANTLPGGPTDEPTVGLENINSRNGTDNTVPTVIVPKNNSAAAPDGIRGTDAPVAMTAGVRSPGNVGRQVQAAKITLLTREEKSVLQRFKKYKGEQDLSSFVALFGPNEGERCRQEPAIAISDGKTPVTIRIDVQSDGTHSTGIALSDATLLSKEAREKDIVITVLPSEGTWDARLVTLAGGEILDYPIVVAPPIDLIRVVNENNFIEALQVYINSRSSAVQRKNKMYLSEYIFTANYLADLDRRARSFVQ